MRERFLPTFASLNAYTIGPLRGQPNKSVIPASELADGHEARLTWPARWENWYRNWMHGQTELTARMPFFNWQSLVGDEDDTGLFVTGPAVRSSRGHTFFANTSSNHWNKLFYTGPVLHRGEIDITPASGNFFPSSAAVRQNHVIVGGTNDTEDEAGLWQVSALDLSTHEITGVIGTKQKRTQVVTDHVTGYVYAIDFGSGALARGDNSTWTTGDLGHSINFTAVALNVRNGLVVVAQPAFESSPHDIGLLFKHFDDDGAAAERDLGISGVVVAFDYLPVRRLYRGVIRELIGGEFRTHVFEFAEPDGDITVYKDVFTGQVMSAAVFDWATVAFDYNRSAVMVATDLAAGGSAVDIVSMADNEFPNGQRMFTDGTRLFVEQERTKNGTNYSRLSASLISL